MKLFSKLNKNGFSLVELMIVVAIIGILATIAAPRYRNFSAKAKQSEVKTTLGTVATMMESYRAEYDTYAGAYTDVGFVTPANARYNYGTGAATYSNIAYVIAATAAANALGQGCSLDVWNINQDRAMANPNKFSCQ